MRITRTIESEVTFEVSFQEACRVILPNIGSEYCDEFENIIDKIILDYNLKIRNPSGLMVDDMKDEVLAKIKEEFSLEKIEQMYESNRKSN